MRTPLFVAAAGLVVLAWRAARGASFLRGGVRRQQARDAQGHGHQDGMDQSARVASR